MKTYTNEERAEAKRKLPQPLSDFLSSDTITNLYMGITEKNKLNLRQGNVMSIVTNSTLIGLEPESALETNFHHELPELSNERVRMLVEDLNTRIFKEAQRRLKENVLEPKAEWDEAELGPRPKAGEKPIEIPSDEELDRLAEEEAKNPPRVDEDGDLIPATPNLTSFEQRNPELHTEGPAFVAVPSDTSQPETSLRATPAGPSIVEQKLKAPVQMKPQEISVDLGNSQKEAPRATPPPAYHGTDPYREPIE